MQLLWDVSADLVSTDPTLFREGPLSHGANLPLVPDEAALEFGRFRLLLRRRQLIADGVALKLGTRAFDILVILLEADGSLVTKEELMSRVWPGIFVAEENLKVQISALRKALGEDRELIQTDCGRGYRCTAMIRSTTDWSGCRRPRRRSSQRSAPQPMSIRCRHSRGVSFSRW